MMEDATDPTGERMRDPEGADTPNSPPPPDDDDDEEDDEDDEDDEPEPLPG
jgi:hypothetical protein